LIRRSSRQPTPAKNAGGATQAEIHEAIEGGEGMEGIEATPPRRVIQAGVQATDENMMQLLFSMLARMEAGTSIPGHRGTEGGRHKELEDVAAR